MYEHGRTNSHAMEILPDFHRVPSYCERYQRGQVCADCGTERADVDARSDNPADHYCGDCIERYAEYERGARYSEEQSAANELARMAWIDSHK